MLWKKLKTDPPSVAVCLWQSQEPDPATAADRLALQVGSQLTKSPNIRRDCASCGYGRPDRLCVQLTDDPDLCQATEERVAEGEDCWIYSDIIT